MANRMDAKSVSGRLAAILSVALILAAFSVRDARAGGEHRVIVGMATTSATVTT